MATQDRLPTGTGASDTWTSSVPGNKWEDVDDPIGTPDDDTTYIYRQDTTSRESFTFTAFAINSSAITKLSVFRRFRRTAAGALSTSSLIRVNGTNYNGSTSTADEAYKERTTDWLTNPDTAAGWLEADVEGTGSNPLTDFGIRGHSINAGEEARCTQIYATVDYTAVALNDTYIYCSSVDPDLLDFVIDGTLVGRVAEA